MSDKNENVSNDREPGQGNSDDGITRRLGKDAESRGEKEVKKMHQGEGKGEEERTREGSQGATKGESSS